VSKKKIKLNILGSGKENYLLDSKGKAKEI
jgi:hypothetical protein